MLCYFRLNSVHACLIVFRGRLSIFLCASFPFGLKMGFGIVLISIIAYSICEQAQFKHPYSLTEVSICDS